MTTQSSWYTKHIFSLITLLGICLLAGPKASAQTAYIHTEANRQFITKAFASWAAGGRTFFEDVLAQDVTWTIKGTSPAAGTYHGRQNFIDRAVKPFATRMSVPVRPTVKDVWAEGNDVIVHWDGEGTAVDGKPYRNSYVWIFRMKNLKAAEVIAYLDLVPYDDIISRIPSPN